MSCLFCLALPYYAYEKIGSLQDLLIRIFDGDWRGRCMALICGSMPCHVLIHFTSLHATNYTREWDSDLSKLSDVGFIVPIRTSETSCFRLGSKAANPS